MKNTYCKLSQQEILALPKRFVGFLLSPFQFNLHNGMVAVPEDTFEEMIEIITEYAALSASSAVTNEDAKLWEFIAANPDKELRCRKKHWAFVGFTNYEYEVFKSPREAVRAALASQGVKGGDHG